MDAAEPLLPRKEASGEPHLGRAIKTSDYGAISTGQPTGTGNVVTSFLLGNLHCPSCVSSIKEALDNLEEAGIVWVSPNIVTSVVTVEHRDKARATASAIGRMVDSLRQTGFEVTSVTTTAASFDESQFRDDVYTVGSVGQGESAVDETHMNGDDGALDRLLRVPVLRRLSTVESKRRRREAHLANCEECRSRPPSPRASDDRRPLLDVRDKAGSSKHAVSPLESVTTVGLDTDSVPSGNWRAIISIGGMTCTSCVRSVEDELNRRPHITGVVVNLVNNSATVDFNSEARAQDIVDAIEDLGYEAALEEVTSLDPATKGPEKDPSRWQATLAIGGMTCASCSNTITAELKKKDWISNVAVNLVSNSATVDFTEEGKDKEIVAAIEDVGYEATLDKVVRLDSTLHQAQERTVEISINGLYCKHCPDRLTHSLAPFKTSLEVVSRPTVQHPRIKVRYTPNAPSFTIRRILDAIEAADPSFEASVYHPPSLEERSKAVTARHQRQLLSRLLLSLVIAIPTFIIGIVYMNILPETDPGRRHLMRPWVSGISRAQIALFILATPVYFFAADVFHMRAYKELKNLWRPGSKTPVLRRLYKFGSMNLLISLGTTIAYASSIGQMIAAPFKKPGQISEAEYYFDSVVFLTLFLLCGRLIEAYSKAKTGDAVEMLGKLRPSTAILVEKDGLGRMTDSVVGVDLVELGDIVRVLHGASPVADGVVIQGEGSFDESSLTGESRLIKKTCGDELFAGTVNKGQALLMRVTGAAGRSMLDQIVQVVREGQTKRAPMERVADMLTAYFVPIITLVAVLTFAVWSLLGLAGVLPDSYLDSGSGGWVIFALQFAIAVFVVACPCGLGLAAPTAIFVGGGLAAKHGILAKGGGEAFENASQVDVVVFDKTGTLTLGGEPKITDSVAFPDAAEHADESKITFLIAALRALESSSSHPVARAIVNYCATTTDERAEVDGIQELPGKGMRATCRGTPDHSSFDMIVGNEALMRDFGVPVSASAAKQLEDWKAEAKSVALAAIKPLADSATTPWILAAMLSISDPVRPEAVSVIEVLRARGTDVWMLSGDNVLTAQAVASRLGIDSRNVLAEVLPSQKADKIGYLQATLKAGSGSGHGDTKAAAGRRAVVAMVGDGINDSPALTRADVGVAVGSGSDVAISSADFVLVSNDLRAVVTLLGLSKAVFRRIRLNFAWAIVYNVLALPVAAGCLYPLTTASGQHVRLDPVWAALAMALSSVSVVLSSLALRTRVPWMGFREERIGTGTD